MRPKREQILNSSANFTGKCRLLADKHFNAAYQNDAFYSDGGNIRERVGNDLASCKTSERCFYKENAASGASDHGVSSGTKAINSRSDNTRKRRFNAMSKYAKPDHRSAARVLGYVLTLGTQDAWWGLVPVLMARLTEAERVSLAFMTLQSLDDDTGYMTASAALFDTLGGEAE